MDSLVKRLLKKQPVKFESKTENIEELKNRLIETKFVFVTFTETCGGTELAINVDLDSSEIKNADFEKGVGIINIVGTCTLDYQKVRCIAEVDIATKEGVGYLELLN